MVAPPVTSLPALNEAEVVFQRLVWNPLFAAGNLALVTAVPELKLPILDVIEPAVEGYVRDYIYSALCLIIDVEVIKLLNAAHQAAYEAASIQLQTVSAEKGNTSPEYQKALADAEASLSNYAQFYT